MVEAEKTKAVALSPLDTERFGIKSAKTTLLTAADLPEVLEFCQEEGVVFLIARCPTNDFETIHRLEENGFKLMDTLIHYKRALAKAPVPPIPSNIEVSWFTPGEAQETTKYDIEKIAAKAFQNFIGHYHADPRLDKCKADEVYSSWALRCCTTPGVAEVVVVAKYEGKIVGLYALKLTPELIGEGVIAGVDPSVQGLKVGRALIIGGLEWCRAIGATKMSAATQLINFKMQRIFVNLGFEPGESFYTFHKWFDE